MKGVPENIHDYSHPFEVDHILERLRQPRSRIRFHKRWERTRDLEMIESIRRCVEVAIHLGFDADEPLSHGEYAADWKTSASMAEKASGSLEAFIKHVTGLGSRHLSQDGEAHLKTPLFSLHNAASNGSVPEKTARAQTDSGRHA